MVRKGNDQGFGRREPEHHIKREAPENDPSDTPPAGRPRRGHRRDEIRLKETQSDIDSCFEFRTKARALLLIPPDGIGRL